MSNTRVILLFFIVMVLAATGCGTNGGMAPPPGATSAAVPDPQKAKPDPSLSPAQNDAYREMANSRSLMDQHYRDHPLGSSPK